MESITSRTNPLITRIRKLTGDRKYRRREGVMVCEGPKMLAEALRWGAGLETILWQTGTHPPAGIPQGVRQVEVPGDLLRSVAPTETPQQVLFLARLPARALPEELTGSRYLVLDGLQDPGNLVLAASEKTLQIPMTERCESLNAAAAGTVVLWQMGFGPVG